MSIEDLEQALHEGLATRVPALLRKGSRSATAQYLARDYIIASRCRALAAEMLSDLTLGISTDPRHVIGSLLSVADMIQYGLQQHDWVNLVAEMERAKGGGESVEVASRGAI